MLFIFLSLVLLTDVILKHTRLYIYPNKIFNTVYYLLILYTHIHSLSHYTRTHLHNTHIHSLTYFSTTTHSYEDPLSCHISLSRENSQFTNFLEEYINLKTVILDNG
jgi:uncharacterized protein involved in tolerance to divalent cations